MNPIPNTDLSVSPITLGTMTYGNPVAFDDAVDLTRYALAQGINMIDTANMYEGYDRVPGSAGGVAERIIGRAIQGLDRRGVLIATKLGMKVGDSPEDAGTSAAAVHTQLSRSLERLGTDYLDVLLLHRPDALVDPEEVAAAFDILEQSGKVRLFGVSNHKPMQIELLKKYVRQDIIADQLQFSIPASNLVANGLEVNMETAGSADRDGSALDYCRIKDITIQAWSPFQMPGWKGCFLGNDAYADLNKELEKLAKQYNVTSTTIAAAWILRHPAQMQIVAGTARESRLAEIIAGGDIYLSREEWYRLYLAAGHILP